MKLTTNKELITLQLEFGEVLQVMFHPDGVNAPINPLPTQLNGLTISSRLLDSGRMALSLYPHHNNLYQDRLTREVIVIDDKNVPQSIKIGWQYGTMNLEKIEVIEIPEEAK